MLTTPRVMHVLAVRKTRLPASDVEINWLQTAIGAQFPIQPIALVADGERVRISSGVPGGIEGIELGSQRSLRLVLSVSVLQRSVLLEIDRDLAGACGALEPAQDGLS